MKKILALVLAMLLVLGMTSAFAASITLKDGDSHTYKVFQVLTGTLSEAGSKQLGNPAWGADATDAAKATSVNDFITEITAAGSEAEVAAKVAAKVDTTGAGRGTVTDGHPLEDLATGYYVLVDVTELTGDHAMETASLNVVQVLNDTTLVNIKYDSTSDDKIIASDSLGKDNATKDNNAVNGKTDDVSVGDNVNFQITAKVPNKTADYDFFYFIINDTLSKGLTLDASSIKVYHGSVAEANLITADSDNGYTTKIDDAADDGSVSFHIGLKNAKAYNNENIYVTYTATLNEDAVIGEEGNPNTSTVTFSNNPNDKYDGTQDDENPGFPAEDKNPALGETPETKTITYSTGIELLKVDENGNVLTGAEFTITGDSTEIVLVSTETFTKKDGGAYYKLNNNTYTTKAPTAEEMKDITSENPSAGYVEDASYTGDDKVVFGGKTYRPYKPAEDADKTIYKHILSNEDQYEKADGAYVKYEKTIEYTQKNTTSGTAATQAVGADGVVKFNGLGEGTYTVTETKTPAGYNTIPAFNLEIKFTANPATGEYHWSKGTGSKDGWEYDAADGVFKITVVNNKGTELPTTGGMGTTLLYIGGSILVLAAAILLVTKRRMNAED